MCGGRLRAYYPHPISNHLEDAMMMTHGNISNAPEETKHCIGLSMSHKIIKHKLALRLDAISAKLDELKPHQCQSWKQTIHSATPCTTCNSYLSRMALKFGIFAIVILSSQAPRPPPQPPTVLSCCEGHVAGPDTIIWAHHVRPFKFLSDGPHHRPLGTDSGSTTDVLTTSGLWFMATDPTLPPKVQFQATAVAVTALQVGTTQLDVVESALHLPSPHLPRPLTLACLAVRVMMPCP